MDFNLTLIGQTIAMIVFVWFVMAKIWPPVMAALDQRRKEIADGIAAGEKGQKELADARHGSDAILALPGLTRGRTALPWIDSYVDAGLGPPDVLRAMTSSAARLLGVDKERGAIRPKMAADLIATTGNPLVDIHALKRVSFVMKDGRIVRR